MQTGRHRRARSLAFGFTANFERRCFYTTRIVGIVWLGDPLTGNHKLRGSRFPALWESDEGTGKLLVFLPANGFAHTRTHGEFYRPPTLSSLPLQNLTWQPERFWGKTGIRR